MSGASLEPAGDGHFRLTGAVVMQTAGPILAESGRLFGNLPAVVVDLRAVTRVDSAALALLIEWLREARAAGRQLSYQGVPDQLRAIAKLTGVEEILAAGDSDAGA